MVRGADCGRVFDAARHFRATQPSQSDMPSKASEQIGLDTLQQLEIAFS